MVYRHGCTWCYEFNARKSGVLIYSGDPNPTGCNTPLKEFCLVAAKVKERLNYDHVGIRIISKARKTLNATGLGIWRNGLTIATCNIIFRLLVVPTALYGCGIWRLNNGVISLLESFQIYAAKKIQHFHGNVHNACCLYALGWMRLERFVQVKKMMFIQAIMVLDDQTLSRRVFCERANVILGRGISEYGQHNYSVVHDLLKTVSLFNLLDDVQNMVIRGHQYPKLVWKNKVWSPAWELEDVYWNVQFCVARNLDIIRDSNVKCRYLTWWYLSDMFPTSMKMCKSLARLVCHASILKTDDVRLKKLNRSERVCFLCDLYEDDNVRHLVMQCPKLQSERATMFTELRSRGGGSGASVIDNTGDILSVNLGRPSDILTAEQMDAFWLVSGKHL